MKKFTCWGIVTVLLMGVFGCSKEHREKKLTVKNTSLELYRESEEKLILENSGETVSYKSRDSNIATVSSDGVVKGWIRGETYIVAYSDGDSAEVKVVVKTKHNKFPEPVLEFGASQSTIKSKLPFSFKISSEEETFIMGKIEILGEIVAYSYTFERGKLTMAVLYTDIDSPMAMEVLKFGAERYVPQTELKSGVFSFISHDKKIIGFIGVDIPVKDAFGIAYAKSPTVTKTATSTLESAFIRLPE